jgi:hypothetical protein
LSTSSRSATSRFSLYRTVPRVGGRVLPVDACLEGGGGRLDGFRFDRLAPFEDVLDLAGRLAGLDQRPAGVEDVLREGGELARVVADRDLLRGPLDDRRPVTEVVPKDPIEHLQLRLALFHVRHVGEDDERAARVVVDRLAVLVGRLRLREAGVHVALVGHGPEQEVTLPVGGPGREVAVDGLARRGDGIERLGDPVGERGTHLVERAIPEVVEVAQCGEGGVDAADHRLAVDVLDVGDGVGQRLEQLGEPAALLGGLPLGRAQIGDVTHRGHDPGPHVVLDRGD